MWLTCHREACNIVETLSLLRKVNLSRNRLTLPMEAGKVCTVTRVLTFVLLVRLQLQPHAASSWQANPNPA